LSAKPSCEYAEPWLAEVVRDACGVGTAVKLRPPSVVRMIAPHGPLAPATHGAGPSSHQVSSPIAVND